MNVKRLVLFFALVACCFLLADVLTHQSTWLIAGNGYVAALLLLTAAKVPR
jgi:hypothetical protein